MYHITTIENLDFILENGLEPRSQLVRESDFLGRVPSKKYFEKYLFCFPNSPYAWFERNYEIGYNAMNHLLVTILQGNIFNSLSDFNGREIALLEIKDQDAEALDWIHMYSIERNSNKREKRLWNYIHCLTSSNSKKVRNYVLPELVVQNVIDISDIVDLRIIKIDNKNKNLFTY